MENCQNCSVRGSRNTELRKRLAVSQAHADALFTALCNVDTTAQAAMEELWTAGGLDCGPEDYDIVVEFALTAIREFKERHQAPLQSRVFTSGQIQSALGAAGQARNGDPEQGGNLVEYGNLPYLPQFTSHPSGTLVVDPSIKWQYGQNVGVQNNPTVCTSE